MDFKGLLNWVGSSVLWAIGTTLTGITLVPGMDWKATFAMAASTFGAAMVQHLRDHPFTSEIGRAHV